MPATDTRAEFELVVIDPDELIAKLSEAELCEVGAFKSRLNAIVDVYIKDI